MNNKEGKEVGEDRDIELLIDSQQQQQVYLSKLENISIYLKHINSRLCQTLHPNRKSTSKGLMLSLILNFDKTVEDYNTYYIRRRMNRLSYFKIEAIAIFKGEPTFQHRLFLNDKQFKNQKMFARFIFVKEDLISSEYNTNYYRMHIQIWKDDQKNPFTNEVFNRYQKSLTNQLINSLNQRGFISSFEGSAVYLKTKRTSLKSKNKVVNDNLNLLDCILTQTEKQLKQIVKVLRYEQPCPYCIKHMIYESRLGIMMPPTSICIIRQPSKQQKILYLHEACLTKYLKPSSLAFQLKSQAASQQKLQQQQL